MFSCVNTIFDVVELGFLVIAYMFSACYDRFRHICNYRVDISQHLKVILANDQHHIVNEFWVNIDAASTLQPIYFHLMFSVHICNIHMGTALSGNKYISIGLYK